MKTIDLEEYMKELEAKKPALMEKIENLGKEYSSTKSLRKRDAEKLIMLLGISPTFPTKYELRKQKTGSIPYI